MLKRTQTWKKYTTAALVGAVVTNMCFAYTTKYKGEREWHVGVQEREQEREWIIPFPKFGNGKGMEEPIPWIWEWEGNEKNLFPKFGNGKGMKKIHSHNSGTGIRGSHPQEYPGTGTGMKKNTIWQ